MSRYRLRPVLPTERAIIFQWRNDPVVRAVMRNTSVIDQEVHKDWWQTAIDDPSRRMMIFEDGKVPIALIHFFELTLGVTAKWGYYFAPGHKTTASALRWATAEVAAVSYAFDCMRLETLHCEVLQTNRSVLLLHERVGFENAGPSQGAFVQKRLDRVGYQRHRENALFARLSQVSIDVDPRDRQRPIPQSTKSTPAKASSKRIVILGSANWEYIARDLQETFRNLVGHPLEVTARRTDQYALELSDPSSAARRNPPDILIFAERFEDLVGAQGEAMGFDELVAENNFSKYLQWIRAARALMPSLFLINSVAPVRPRLKSIEEALTGSEIASELALLFNDKLLQLGKMDDTLLVPLADQIGEVGRRNSDPGKYWYVDHIPYGQALVDRWTSCISGMIAQRDESTVRALIAFPEGVFWPVDATERESAEIFAHNDWPGNPFSGVQRCLKMLADRGVLFAICDDSDRAVTSNALRHLYSRVADSNLASRCAGRGARSEKIQSMARDLGVPEHSVMVLVGDPIERAKIREASPDVIVPELPWDVADWPRFLANHPLLTQSRSRAAKSAVKQKIASEGD